MIFEPSQQPKTKEMNIKDITTRKTVINGFDSSQLYGVKVSQIAPIARSMPAEMLSGKSLDLDSFTYAAVPADIVPARANNYSLGTTTAPWLNVYANKYFDASGDAIFVFKTIVPTTGTNPVADNLTDTLTLTSSDNSVVITGNATTDTLDFSASTTVLGTTFLRLDATNSPVTGTLTIQNSADAKELIVKAKSSQTANLQEWQDSSANILAQMTAGARLGVSSNTSTTLAKVGGSIFDHYTDVGNGTTVETDLYSDTIAANTLSTNGDKLQAQYGGTFVSSGTATREIKIYFAGTMIFDTGALTLSFSSQWSVYVTIIRVSASVVRYMVSLTTEGAALSAYTSAGELTGLTLSGTNILKITGQAAGVGAATNDIVAKLGNVAWFPAA